jgi:glycosyltransferase involved in cell wall biosynthesis
MNILFLFVSLPNLGDASTGLFGDLIHEFQRQGHQVTAVAPTDEPTQVRMEGDIRVLRIHNTNPTKVAGVRKALTYMQLAARYVRHIKRHFCGEHFDWMVFHTMPPELGIILPTLKRATGAKAYLIESDTQWQGAVSMGMYSVHSPICKYYQFLERRLLKNTDKFMAPSEKNFELVQKSLPSLHREDFEVVHWWGPQQVVPKGDKQAILKSLGVDAQFVVIYGGNMGVPQYCPELIRLAESVKEYKDIKFLMLISGVKAPDFKQDVAKSGLTNIQFLPFMPREEYEKLLAVCDAGFIILSPTKTTPSIPSKSIAYYQHGIPILASINRGSDFGEILTRENTGLYSVDANDQQFHDNLMKLYQNPELRRQMSENMHRVYTTDMNVVNVVKRMSNQMK